MVDINTDLLQWSINFLIKNLFRLQINLLPAVVLKMKISQKKNQFKNYTNHSLENSKKEKFTNL